MLGFYKTQSDDNDDREMMIKMARMMMIVLMNDGDDDDSNDDDDDYHSSNIITYVNNKVDFIALKSVQYVSCNCQFDFYLEEELFCDLLRSIVDRQSTHNKQEERVEESSNEGKLVELEEEEVVLDR